MFKVLLLTMSSFYTSNAVQIALYIGSSTAACSDQANLLGNVTGFSGLCTASNGMAITFASCSESRVTYVYYPDSSTDEKVNPPKCGKGAVKSYEITKQCTLLEKECFLGADCYSILIDSTCEAPSNVYLVSNHYPYKCSARKDQRFNLAIPYGNCFTMPASGLSHIATEGPSENSINFTTFSNKGCNKSLAVASWSNVSANGVCVDAINSTLSQSIRVEKPIAFTYIPGPASNSPSPRPGPGTGSGAESGSASGS